MKNSRIARDGYVQRKTSEAMNDWNHSNIL